MSTQSKRGVQWALQGSVCREKVQPSHWILRFLVPVAVRRLRVKKCWWWELSRSRKVPGA